MSGWPEVSLGDHVDLLAGFAFKSSRFLDESEGGVRLLRGDNVGQGALRWSGAKHWPEAEYQELERYQLREGDVILAMDRPWIEAGLKYAYVRRSDMPCLLVQRVARLRGRDTLDTGFLRYIIGSSAFTGHVKGIITGVNVPHISGRDISRFRFRLPPLAAQKRIASILGAYDDLIEVNRRRVAVLEEIARGLFEEWFVRFRFPGHEGVSVVDTAEGSLPEGWAWGTIADVAETVGATRNPSSTPEENFAHFSLPAFDASRTPALDKGEDIKSNKIEFAAPVVLVSKLNPRIPRVWHVPTSGPLRQLASTEFVPLAPKGAYESALIWAMVRDASFTGRLIAMAGGTSTSHQRVRPRDILATPVPLPPDQVVQDANRHIGPLALLALNLEAANRSLAASRDLLLPRLISGQLSVEAAERELEDAA